MSKYFTCFGGERAYNVCLMVQTYMKYHALKWGQFQNKAYCFDEGILEEMNRGTYK